MQKIEEIVGEVLDAMRRRGLREYTLKHENWSHLQAHHQLAPYAAEHPEEHAAKEDIYESLMAGRISALDEKLAALGQTQEDYLPSEIEKFKDATGYEEFLDFDPAVIREAIQNSDKSHADEMLAFAEAGRAGSMRRELSGQTPAPSPDDRETGETVRTPRGTFYVTDMSREQMEAAGYGLHHQSDDGKYLVMGNGSRSFAIRKRGGPGTYHPGKDDRPGGGAHEEALCEGDRPRPPFVTGGSGRRHCHRLSPSPTRWGWSCNDEGKLIGPGAEPGPAG